ncbi:MAG: peptide chain release factor N(5)-glutamine methyltransferase [Corallococcus sp.]|nr:peptide chain release factor N(5)-glutamine methyltransferase [Corallococcus sp.]MCM1359932.1 peptide chain release factor N(5)-glutamine methyltransferase [Corallococcus sp.]MCM1395488.1 peptide chain release factor N(5)-glutamine methyltransferase [Corallococcus sp.]
MKTRIGGQAVIEGVMMRGATSEALSVRDEMGQIRVETKRLPLKKPWYRKVPFLRGVINLVVSMIDGFKIIGKSAEVMVEDEIDTSGKGMGGLMFFSVLFGLALAVALFIIAPTYLTKGITLLFPSLDWDGKFVWLNALLEGVFKILVLVAYMGTISCMKEIKRVFMYHGAEHKTIACYEAEMPLTVENVQKCSRYHDRCGTSFIVFVVVLSVVLMLVLDIVCIVCNFTLFIENRWLRALLKIALLPVTAGFSYEMLMLLARTNFVLFRPLKWLGKQFQKLTTKEPDDAMCEVAICSFNKVLEMDADQSIPEEHFPDPITLAQFREQVETCGITEYAGKADDWLVCALLRIKPEDLQKDLKIPFGWTVRLQKYAERMANGEPWQYVLGVAPFYSRNFTVDKNVLIPRAETELVAEQVIKRLDKCETVLDLCCGSGAIGITVACEVAKMNIASVGVTCADISRDALKVAKRNAKKLKARVKFTESDMFAKIKGKFDFIVCNPPYIQTSVIETLDAGVKDYEPRLALDGGADGLDFYRILAKESPRHLRENGVLVLEIGYDEGEAVRALLQQNFEVQVLKDYGGNDRIVIATLK